VNLSKFLFFLTIIWLFIFHSFIFLIFPKIILVLTSLFHIIDLSRGSFQKINSNAFPNHLFFYTSFGSIIEYVEVYFYKNLFIYSLALVLFWFWILRHLNPRFFLICQMLFFLTIFFFLKIV
jgi:hypothetical protein